MKDTKEEEEKDEDAQRNKGQVDEWGKLTNPT